MTKDEIIHSLLAGWTYSHQRLGITQSLLKAVLEGNEAAARIHMVELHYLPDPPLSRKQVDDLVEHARRVTN